ncbi:MAG: ABC-F family ATP-binding cassette domain-containing protein [Rhodothermaceae bacterium]|nr:ABC-F family ATP-binding cassette domain-containing protein [Rhodothermaceae bacterium]
MSDLNFQVYKGDRTGLVGPNGAGKTTLLKMIAGRIQPDEGQISMQSGTTVGFLEQEVLEVNPKLSVKEVAMEAFDEVNRIEDELNRIGHELAKMEDYHSDAYHKLLERMEKLQTRFDFMEGAVRESKAEAVLEGLGFKTHELDQPLERFSGGWRMRVLLARLLLQKPDLLLLDEPTNHLDIDSIEWLEQYLTSYQGAVILVSHDRYFLNRMVTQIAEIRSRKIYSYKGNYDHYEIQKAELEEQQVRDYESQKREIAEKERFIERFRAKATKSRQVQSRVKALEKLDRVDAPDADTSSIRFRFPEPPRSGKVVIGIKNLIKTYKSGDKPDVHVFTKGQDLEIERGDKIALIGVNGAGKSTLARILYGNETFAGTRISGHNIITTFFAQHLAEVLVSNRTVLEEMESGAITTEARGRVRGILGSFLFSGSDVDKRVSVLSGGERSRLALAKTLLQPANFLILDEPTNHLDMLSKSVLLQALDEYSGTILAVSHDRHFLSGFANKIWRTENGRVEIYEGGYDYYEWKRKDKSQGKASVQNNGRDKMASKQTENTAPSDQNSSGPKTKEQRREEAELRNRINRETSGLRKEIRTCETEMADLEKKKADLEQKIADPKVYESGDAQALLNEFRLVGEKLDALLERWTSASEKLENKEEEFR